MFLVPTLVDGVNHPLINALYLKKGVNARGGLENVLVAHTTLRSPDSSAPSSEDDEDQLFDLLADMPSIGRRVKTVAGPFSHVEIRYAS